MQPTDKPAFGLLVTGYLQEIYEKSITPALLNVWWGTLAGYALCDIESAFARYVAHPEDCRFAPKPGDIVRHMSLVQGDDGRPGGDEAWGMLLRLIRDEAETGVLSEEMRQGWEACGPILAEGDEVGARRCFLEVYDRCVREARAAHVALRWTVTLGTDPTLRDQRITEAVHAKRLTRDHAVGLLSGPAPASLEQVAGLLEGPEAPPEERQAAHRLRELAAMLRQGMADDAEAQRAERTRQRAEEAARKDALVAQIAEYLAQRGDEDAA